MRHEKALVIFSGGQDSTTALYWARRKFASVQAITFDYGQRHRIELECATDICEELKIPQKIVSLDFFKNLNHTALTDDQEPARLSGGLNNLPNTFVPGRNALFMSVAVAFGLPRGIHHYVMGVCETDYSGYPDCREAFIKAQQKALGLAVDASVFFHTPLMKLNKSQTFALARELGCLETVIEKTHTCYLGERKDIHDWGFGCGTCPACVLRKKGFNEYTRSLDHG